MVYCHNAADCVFNIVEAKNKITGLHTSREKPFKRVRYLHILLLKVTVNLSAVTRVVLSCLVAIDADVKVLIPIFLQQTNIKIQITIPLLVSEF